MPLRATSIASNALRAHSRARSVAAHNVANVLTSGFRASRADFSETLHGSGTHVSSTPRSNHTGSLVLTGGSLDLAIGGSGFFVVEGEDGLELTRNGRFQLNAQGRVVDGSGRTLRPGIALPADTARVGISRYGDVVATQSSGKKTYVGTIQLATVANPGGLVARGESSFGLSAAAGPLIRSAPGQSGFGFIVQGGFESSNVDMIKATVDGVVSSRAFDANAGVFRVASAMTGELMRLGDAVEKRGLRKTKEDLMRTQASRLVGVFRGDSHDDEETQARELSSEVRARLRARRLSASDIAEIQRTRFRYRPERFNDAASGNVIRRKTLTSTDKILLNQELRIAQRQAASAR